MSKYKEGHYLIRLFDEYGTPCGWGDTQTTSVAAIKTGKQAVAAGECESFAALRVFYNSVAHHERWLPSPGQLERALAIIRTMEESK